MRPELLDLLKLAAILALIIVLVRGEFASVPLRGLRASVSVTPRLLDGDEKFTTEFARILHDAGIQVVRTARLPPNR